MRTQFNIPKIIGASILNLVLNISFAQDPTYITGPEVDDFIARVAEKHNLEPRDLGYFLYNAKYQPGVIAAIQKPAEKLPWYKYETIFLNDKRIKDGVKFWQDNASTLERASKEYGVPPQVIVALIGVETLYGSNKGKYPVLDTLATLAFYYKPRSAFFSSELEQFLVLSREDSSDPRTYLGSYAGAMGYPQFIPSSIRNYAVDYSNSGTRDLQENVPNAIGSVANYLNKFGWKKDEPITTTVSLAKLSKKNHQALSPHIDKLKPELNIKKLKQLGVDVHKNYKTNLDTSILAFESQKGKQYRLGFNNFYVITRYNNSQNYALAVYLLSEKIKQEYKTAGLATEAKKV